MRIDAVYTKTHIQLKIISVLVLEYLDELRRNTFIMPVSINLLLQLMIILNMISS
jgi:hypothetical protein